MERLVFSSSLPSKTTPLNPRLLLPRLSSTPIGKLAAFPLPRANLRHAASFFVEQEGYPSVSSPSSISRRKFAVWCSSGANKAPAPVDSGRLVDGRRSDVFLRKVASAGLLALLSTLILTLIHPVVAPPANAVFHSAGGSLAKSELFSSAWTGFVAGCLHTLSGPDHLAALAPLSIGRTRTESAFVGVIWGCGHDAGQLLFGLLFLLLKDRLHIEVIRAWCTRVVGLTLFVIGAMGIREASEVPMPRVALENGEYDASMLEPYDAAVPIGKKKIGFTTFATGIVHGLQPDALIMILPALALPSRLAGVAFLGMFLVGTIFSMGSYTAFIGSCSQLLKERVPRITEKLTVAASLVALCMGLAILVSQFFGFSLY